MARNAVVEDGDRNREKETNVRTEFVVGRNLTESFTLSVETVVKMVVGRFAELGDLEIKSLEDPGIDSNAQMTVYAGMARVSALRPNIRVCDHCLREFISAHRDPEYDPEFWDDGIGEAVARVLSAWPDASDEEVVQLYGEYETATNAILANPYVVEAVGKLLARIATIEDLSEEKILRECIRTVALGNDGGTSDRSVSVSVLH